MNNVSLQSYFIFIAPNIDQRFCQHHQPSTVTSCTMHRMVQENKETSLDKLALIEYIDKDGRYDDALCNVFRSGTNNKQKISSYGFLATFLNCSVIVGFTEQPCSEGSKYEILSIFLIIYNI
jgi:hypothetical protein